LTQDDWYWEYRQDLNQWHFHASDYSPEISFKIGYYDGRVIGAFHRDTTMPQEVKEILSRMLVYIDLYFEANKGITKIIVPRDEVLLASRRVLQFKSILEKRGNTNASKCET